MAIHCQLQRSPVPLDITVLVMNSLITLELFTTLKSQQIPGSLMAMVISLYPMEAPNGLDIGQSWLTLLMATMKESTTIPIPISTTLVLELQLELQVCLTMPELSLTIDMHLLPLVMNLEFAMMDPLQLSQLQPPPPLLPLPLQHLLPPQKVKFLN